MGVGGRGAGEVVGLQLEGIVNCERMTVIRKLQQRWTRRRFRTAEKKAGPFFSSQLQDRRSRLLFLRQQPAFFERIRIAGVFWCSRSCDRDNGDFRTPGGLRNRGDQL